MCAIKKVLRRPRKCKYRQTKGCFFKQRNCCFCISVRVLFVGWQEQISQFVHRTVAEYWVWRSRIVQIQKTSPNIPKHLKIIGIPKSSRTCSNNKDGQILSDSRPNVKQSIDILQSVAVKALHRRTLLPAWLCSSDGSYKTREQSMVSFWVSVDQKRPCCNELPYCRKTPRSQKLLFRHKQSATKIKKIFK